MITALLTLLFLATHLRSAQALDIDLTSGDSIRSAAATLASSVLSYYTHGSLSGNTTVDQLGTFPYPPYYWWESGAIWGALIDYAAYTSDNSYLNTTLNALAAQTGPNLDFVVPAQSWNEANDDQAFWLFAALSALETDLPPLDNACSSGADMSCPTSYLRIADNAFNVYVQRYNADSSTCNGGLRWQYNKANKGWDYKNSVSNGGFFQLAARLARYTGNSTYADWASKVYDWSEAIGLVSDIYEVFDGTDVTKNCSAINRVQFSYNTAMYMYGAAAMYDYSKRVSSTASITGQVRSSALAGEPQWSSRVSGFINSAQQLFFAPFPSMQGGKNVTGPGIMYEPACEPGATCNTDMVTYKGIMARWISKSALLVPEVRGQASRLLRTAAVAAAGSCKNGSGTVVCGTTWYGGGFDGKTGLGQQLAVLEAVQALLVR